MITVQEFREFAPVLGALARLDLGWGLPIQRERGVRAPLAALRGLQFGAALIIAERPPVVSEVLCWAGSSFCRGIAPAVAAMRRRPISRAEILRELEERTGLRVWSVPWGTIVGGSGDPDRMSCRELEDPAGILGLTTRTREEIHIPTAVYSMRTREYTPRPLTALEKGRKLKVSPFWTVF